MEITDEFLEEMIHALRVSQTEEVEMEVTSLCLVALSDLKRQGVDIISLGDPMTKQAVKLYCKAHYGYDNNAERFEAAYVSLSAAMSLCGDYDGSDTNA